MMKKQEKHPLTRKETDLKTKSGKKEKEIAVTAENETKLTKTGGTQGNNPKTDHTKSNKMKAGKPYKEQ